MTDEEKEPSITAGTGGYSNSAWARHAREDLQGTHSLHTPLARWAPELVESAPLIELPKDTEPEFSIPASVLKPRPPSRLPGDELCRSPIAGLVVAVMAEVGDRVARRQAVMVIEAMKMQNNVCAEVDGVLTALHVAPGDSVKAGQILFETGLAATAAAAGAGAGLP